MNHPRTVVTQGDIKRVAFRAIVNAANYLEVDAGVVDDAMHRAVGLEMPRVGCTLRHCASADAMIEQGIRQRARRVAHTVDPVWRGDDQGAWMRHRDV